MVGRASSRKFSALLAVIATLPAASTAWTTYSISSPATGIDPVQRLPTVRTRSTACQVLDEPCSGSTSDQHVHALDPVGPTAVVDHVDGQGEGAVGDGRVDPSEGGAGEVVVRVGRRSTASRSSRRPGAGCRCRRQRWCGSSRSSRSSRTSRPAGVSSGFTRTGLDGKATSAAASAALVAVVDDGLQHVRLDAVQVGGGQAQHQGVVRLVPAGAVKLVSSRGCTGRSWTAVVSSSSSSPIPTKYVDPSSPSRSSVIGVTSMVEVSIPEIGSVLIAAPAAAAAPAAGSRRRGGRRAGRRRWPPSSPSRRRRRRRSGPRRTRPWRTAAPRRPRGLRRAGRRSRSSAVRRARPARCRRSRSRCCRRRRRPGTTTAWAKSSARSPLRQQVAGGQAAVAAHREDDRTGEVAVEGIRAPRPR